MAFFARTFGRPVQCASVILAEYALPRAVDDALVVDEVGCGFRQARPGYAARTACCLGRRGSGRTTVHWARRTAATRRSGDGARLAAGPLGHATGLGEAQPRGWWAGSHGAGGRVGHRGGREDEGCKNCDRNLNYGRTVGIIVTGSRGRDRTIYRPVGRIKSKPIPPLCPLSGRNRRQAHS